MAKNRRRFLSGLELPHDKDGSRRCGRKKSTNQSEKAIQKKMGASVFFFTAWTSGRKEKEESGDKKGRGATFWRPRTARHANTKRRKIKNVVTKMRFFFFRFGLFVSLGTQQTRRARRTQKKWTDTGIRPRCPGPRRAVRRFLVRRQ